MLQTFLFNIYVLDVLCYHLWQLMSSINSKRYTLGKINEGQAGTLYENNDYYDTNYFRISFETFQKPG